MKTKWIEFLSTVCRRALFAVVKQMALLSLHTAHYVCEESAMTGFVFMDWPFVCRLRCLRGAGCCPPGRRLVAPTPSRSVETGLLDLAKYIGAEVWLRRFLLWPSLSIGLDLAFLLMVPGVGNRLPKPGRRKKINLHIRYMYNTDRAESREQLFYLVRTGYCSVLTQYLIGCLQLWLNSKLLKFKPEERER